MYIAETGVTTRVGVVGPILLGLGPLVQAVGSASEPPGGAVELLARREPGVGAVREHRGHAYTLAPNTVDPARLMKPSEGGITGQRAARDALADVLATFTEHGAACVVVEDETRLKRDPKPSADGLLRTAFVDERVIHWATLEGGTEAAIITLSHGSGGYPLNAFVSSASERKLDSVDGADISHDIGCLVTQSLVAVIVSAYDDETFIIWEPDQRRITAASHSLYEQRR